jgi:hypothetical protein
MPTQAGRLECPYQGRFIQEVFAKFNVPGAVPGSVQFNSAQGWAHILAHLWPSDS